MSDLEDYKILYRKQEAEYLAERKKLIGQKQLIGKVFTTEAMHKREHIEKRIAELERKIIEIRTMLGENYKNN
jgi:hypothetical protein